MPALSSQSDNPFPLSKTQLQFLSAIKKYHPPRKVKLNPNTMPKPKHSSKSTNTKLFSRSKSWSRILKGIITSVNPTESKHRSQLLKPKRFLGPKVEHFVAVFSTAADSTHPNLFLHWSHPNIIQQPALEDRPRTSKPCPEHEEGWYEEPECKNWSRT